MTRNRALATLLIIYLMLTPIIASYIVTSVSGITKDVEITYNASEKYYLGTMRVSAYNGSWFGQDNAIIFDNNKTAIVTSVQLSQIDNLQFYIFMFLINITGLLSDVYKIEIVYTYIGTGNITYLTISAGDSITFGTMINEYTVEAFENPPETNTTSYIIILETFQSLKLESNAGLKVVFKFDDLSYLPSDGDYIEVTVSFYRKDTLISREQLIQIVLTALAILNFFIAISITNLYNPTKIFKPRRRRRRARRR